MVVTSLFVAIAKATSLKRPTLCLANEIATVMPITLIVCIYEIVVFLYLPCVVRHQSFKSSYFQLFTTVLHSPYQRHTWSLFGYVQVPFNPTNRHLFRLRICCLCPFSVIFCLPSVPTPFPCSNCFAYDKQKLINLVATKMQECDAVVFDIVENSAKKQISITHKNIHIHIQVYLLY